MDFSSTTSFSLKETNHTSQLTTGGRIDRSGHLYSPVARLRLMDWSRQRLLQPYAITVEKHIPYPVSVPVAVPVDRPYPVHVPKPYLVPVERPVPVTVARPYPVPVEYPVKYPVPTPVPVPVAKPYPVYVHDKGYDDEGDYSSSVESDDHDR
ncbi:hypothetical protein J6590_073856 [Homalodisca vitripennis]|nr:hypothetical protein J6590_073856 [Homalodisca vitripennis]